MSNPIYSQSFEGIVTVITNIIQTVSGVGTTSFTLSPDGYPSNFGGVVSALADLNSTISGIYTYSAGSGLYLVNNTEFNIDYNQVFQGSVSGHVLAEGSNTVLPSGDYITVSGTDISSVKNYTAGESISVGQFVCFDAGSLVKASAASGVDSTRYNTFGCAVTAGGVSDTIKVNSDNIVTLSSSNITADAALTPGESYYLSKFYGEVTRFSTTSGTITFAEGYGALVYVGRALSTTQLEVEIQPKILLTE